jgi:hypothetical protein
MTPAEIGWAAGLFEGEGSICIFETKHNVLPQIRLAITMTDRDVLVEFCRVVECGRVGPERRYGREHHKPSYVWQIGNRADVERILLAFLPWFRERRTAKAKVALAEIAKLDHVCRTCGKTFRARRLDMICCSVKCRNRWHYMNRRPEEASHMGRPRTLDSMAEGLAS